MKKKYSISGIDCANCAAKLEAKMNELPEVDSVTLTFATGQLAVEAEDHETALEKLRELAEKMEPGTVIEEIKRGRHEHGHNHAEGESCGCGGHHHHEHGHHHEEGDKCCCGKHHHHEHEHHNHKHDSISAEKKKSNGIAAMLLEEKKELLTICIGAVLFAAGLICEKVVPSYSFISLAVFIVGYLI
ncbi:MAG: cation transporter, partial [Lachnospiraceae bacterium]|nr:cation transporter [Lachnospiraceae bacterium]